MKKVLAILACNFINKISKLFGKQGTVIGGSIALKIDKNILKEIKYPKYVIGVSGSSGKGSATSMIAGLLDYSGLTYAYNSSGSNAINGITSLILANSDLKGNYKKDVLLMELDEKHSVAILKNFDLTHYVLTNITRDQPPRNAHPDYIFNEMKKNVRDNTTLIVNADDPIVYRLSLNHKNNLYYGINKNDYSIDSPYNYKDAAYCPICGKKLIYDYYHYGHLGKYRCENNDFARPNLNFYAHSLDLENRLIRINSDEVLIKDEFLYSVYAYLACYTLGKSINIDKEKILEYFKTIKDKQDNEVFIHDNRTWHILLSKSENNLSYKQSLDYIVRQKGIKTVVTGFNHCSRRYAENDISWLWDIDFEELKDDSIDSIVIVGKFRYNILNRLLYAGISKDKCILVEDYTEELIDVVNKNTNGTIYPVVCFDTGIELNKLLKGGEKHDN